MIRRNSDWYGLLGSHPLFYMIFLQDPKDNLYYNLERPEGVLEISHRALKQECSVSSEMDIYLSEKTEKYRMLKEVYSKESEGKRGAKKRGSFETEAFSKYQLWLVTLLYHTFQKHPKTEAF